MQKTVARLHATQLSAVVSQKGPSLDTSMQLAAKTVGLHASGDSQQLGTVAHLQNSGEFAVPVGHMIGPAICECIDNVAKRTQRLVDQLAFFQCLSLSRSPGLTLTASQVHLQSQPGSQAMQCDAELMKRSLAGSFKMEKLRSGS